VALCALLVSRCLSAAPLRSCIRRSATRLLPPTFLPSRAAPSDLRFRRRAADSVRSRRLVRAAGESRKETQPEDSMKYLLSIVAALALVGTASATSRSADCCGGG